MEHLVQETLSFKGGFREEFSGAAEEFFAEDEMDAILSGLPQIMPPPSLVGDIMIAVSRVALAEIVVPVMPLDALDEFPVSSVPGQYC